MAIKLTKRVRRELLGVSATKKGRLVERGAAGARPVSIELAPGDDIVFQIKGTRQRFEIPAVIALQHAMSRAIAYEYERKLKIYKDRKARGLRTKRPVKPFNPNKFKY